MDKARLSAACAKTAIDGTAKPNVTESSTNSIVPSMFLQALQADFNVLLSTTFPPTQFQAQSNRTEAVFLCTLFTFCLA
jgi:hypothetical protein